MFLHLQPKILLAAFVASISIMSGNTYAQQREEVRYVVVGVDCNDDEHAKAILDHASIDAKKDETIFIIARLGTGVGHVEVYLGGKLFALFKMKRHRDFGQGPLCKIIFD